MFALAIRHCLKCEPEYQPRGSLLVHLLLIVNGREGDCIVWFLGISFTYYFCIFCFAATLGITGISAHLVL